MAFDVKQKFWANAFLFELTSPKGLDMICPYH
jgi:hypothetical protein